MPVLEALEEKYRRSRHPRDPKGIMKLPTTASEVLALLVSAAARYGRLPLRRVRSLQSV
jgi:hypothetical protein